jgi:prolyl-tRNA synthetase
MRLSRYFLPILRENPKEAEIVSHRLMLRAGMIRQESAGIYAWLPLGLRGPQQGQRGSSARSRIGQGAVELLMPTIQSAELWREAAATTPTARRCCASRTGTSARCCTGRPTRK